MVPEALDESLAVARDISDYMGAQFSQEDTKEFLQKANKEWEVAEKTRRATASMGGGDETVTFKDQRGLTLTFDAADFASIVNECPNSAEWHVWNKGSLELLVAEAKKRGNEYLAEKLAEYQSATQGITIVVGPDGWTPSTQPVKKFAGAKPEEAASVATAEDQSDDAERLDPALLEDINAYFGVNEDGK